MIKTNIDDIISFFDEKASLWDSMQECNECIFAFFQPEKLIENLAKAVKTQKD